jgi:hypothetical protein
MHDKKLNKKSMKKKLTKSTNKKSTNKKSTNKKQNKSVKKNNKKSEKKYKMMGGEDNKIDYVTLNKRIDKLEKDIKDNSSNQNSFTLNLIYKLAKKLKLSDEDWIELVS